MKSNHLSLNFSFGIQTALKEKWKRSSFNRKRYAAEQAYENEGSCCRACQRPLTNNENDHDKISERRCMDNVSVQSREGQKICATKEQVRRSEILNILSVIDKNHSFDSVDKNRLLYKAMFPDSKIADSYYMSGTKLQYLVKFGLLDYAKRIILRDMKNCSFSVHFDEVFLGDLNDQVQFDVYTTYFSTVKQKVCTEYVESLSIPTNTPGDIAASIFSFIQNFKLNINHLVRISIRCACDDILYVKAIVAILKQQTLCTILDVIPCPQQIFNTAFSKLITAVKPVLDVNQMVRDFDNFFLYATCQKPDYPFLSELTNVVSAYFHSHVFNKWMFLEEVLVYIVKEWGSLSEYFLETLPMYEISNQSLTLPIEYTRIKKYLQNKTTLVVIEFSIYIASHFRYFFKPLQGNESMLPLMHTYMLQLLNDLSNVFKLSDFTKKESAKKDQMGSDNAKYSLLQRKVCDFRIKFDILVNQLDKVEKREVFQTFKVAMDSTTEHLLERLPLTNQLIFDAKFLYYENTVLKGAESAFCRLATNIERILGPAKMRAIFDFDANFAVVDFESIVQNEYKLYEKEDLLAAFVEQCDGNVADTSDDLKTKPRSNGNKVKYQTDYFWSIIGNITHKDGAYMFGHLSKMVQCILTMFPLYKELHTGFDSNIALIRSTSSSNITSDTLSTLRTVKDFIKKSGGIENVIVTEEMLGACANAYRLYATYCLEKKNELLGTMKLFEEKQKEIAKRDEKKMIEQLEKDVKDIKGNIDAAEERLSEGNKMINKLMTIKTGNEATTASYANVLNNSTEKSPANLKSEVQKVQSMLDLMKGVN